MTVPSTTDEDRLRRIEFVTDSALAHLDVKDLLDELLDRVRSLLGVDTAAVLLFDASATHLVATAARGIEEEVRQGVRIPLGQGFAGRIAAERRPVIIEQVDHSNVLNPILREKAIRSLLGVPLVIEGTVLGVLHVGTLTPRRFTEADTHLLQLVADRVALVTRTHQSDVDRAAAEALQHSLMPGTLPQIAGLELTARYVPGQAGGLGGDWYDVFTLPSGRVGVVMGDVVGRGFQAAVVMGRLRSALRAFAREEDDPAEVLERLDGNVQHFEDNVMATVLYAVFEPSLDQVMLTVAGHLPPVLAVPGDAGRLLQLPVDLPVGVSVGPPRRTTVIDLPPGSLLFLYTDGLVERRGRSLDEGLDRLCGAVRAVDIETTCTTVMSRMVGAEPVADDVAVLVAHRAEASEAAPLYLVLPAVLRSLAEVRSALRRWLASVGATPDDVTDILVAVGEACSNVVEHAYGPGGGNLMLHAERGEDQVTVTVWDNGRWRSARGENRGRGTTLMQQCSDAVDVTAGPHGTTVRMQRHLSGETR
ncbi:SpoIIE family protein phosphatase [Actinomycetospora endophytica]|uniref:SpoIIE family protein phosphatase n=1 Tax=Actinomycetospora endophytica TaxID=2291215 RepID=A0ABS8PIP8_9PSEU|nr:SpoIIE family protein phosphatase [Actinomycetospora endophytica]MCD2198143.1 SpoIIE family protein phosphatase [Actinomycetospora endophytica]